MLLYVEERGRWQLATVNSLTSPPPAPSAALRPASGWEPCAARLRHSSAQPTGTQSLCRFLGSFTVCQITASLVLRCLAGASSAHAAMPRPFWDPRLSVSKHTFTNYKRMPIRHKTHVDYKVETFNYFPLQPNGSPKVSPSTRKGLPTKRNKEIWDTAWI